MTHGATHGDARFSVPLFSKVSENLWFGGFPREALPVDLIVDVYGGIDYPRLPETEYVKWPLLDSLELDVPGDIIDGLAATVKKALDDGKTVYVHCHMGLNRSAVVVAKVLIDAGFTPKQAIDTVRIVRHPLVLSNFKFVNWLMKDKPL